MTYATIEELAAALRITVSPQNTTVLQTCLDAAAVEIDDAVDWLPRVNPLGGPPDPLLNRVNILRGVEWFKSQDAAFGIIGSTETGALRAPRNGFARHAATLLPLKEQWGVA